MLDIESIKEARENMKKFKPSNPEEMVSVTCMSFSGVTYFKGGRVFIEDPNDEDQLIEILDEDILKKIRDELKTREDKRQIENEIENIALGKIAKERLSRTNRKTMTLDELEKRIKDKDREEYA
jgi:hypothetical protein